MCCGRVQLDGGGAGDKVEELGDSAAKRGRPHRVHGNKGEVIVWSANNALDGGGLKGSIDAVPDGNEGGGERAAIAFDD